MKCEQCGFENLEGSVFCSQCGTRLAVECPKCGKTVPQGSRFCNYCGQNLSSSNKRESIPHKTVVANREKRNHSSVFSFRRVGSILIVWLSVLFIILQLSTIDDFNGLGFFLLGFYLLMLYCGVRGFNSENAKYGAVVIAITIGICVISLVGIYSYNESVNYFRDKLSYSGTLVVFFSLLLPAIFMCITPRGLKDDGRVLWYCKNCNKFWEGDYDMVNNLCPDCEEETIRTSISARKWEYMSDREIEESKEYYRNL